MSCMLWNRVDMMKVLILLCLVAKAAKGQDKGQDVLVFETNPSEPRDPLVQFDQPLEITEELSFCIRLNIHGPKG